MNTPELQVLTIVALNSNDPFTVQRLCKVSNSIKQQIKASNRNAFIFDHKVLFNTVLKEFNQYLTGTHSITLLRSEMKHLCYYMQIMINSCYASNIEMIKTLTKSCHYDLYISKFDQLKAILLYRCIIIWMNQDSNLGKFYHIRHKTIRSFIDYFNLDYETDLHWKAIDTLLATHNIKASSAKNLYKKASKNPHFMEQFNKLMQTIDNIYNNYVEATTIY